MVGDLPPRALERLARLIGDRSGMEITAARWPFLQNRVQTLMMQDGSADVDTWTAAVEVAAAAGGASYAELEAALLVHETSFLRYPEHLGILGRSLAAAASRTGGTAPIRIWSVGCSTGQEPYTLAMATREHLGPRAADMVEIVAVDVSRPALAVAEAGIYRRAATTALPPAWQERYLHPHDADVTIAPEVRALVRFLHYDLRHGLFLGKFDLVFCCNVLLYFTRAIRLALVRRLGEGLHSGGHLVLGHADGVTPPGDVFEARGPDGFVYRRR